MRLVHGVHCDRGGCVAAQVVAQVWRFEGVGWADSCLVFDAESHESSLSKGIFHCTCKWVPRISRLTGAIQKFTFGSAFVCTVHMLRCEVGSVARNVDLFHTYGTPDDKRGFDYWFIEAENEWVLSIARSAFVRSGERCVDCGVGEAAEYALSGTVEIGGRSLGEVLIMGAHAKINIISFTVMRSSV